MTSSAIINGYSITEGYLGIYVHCVECPRRFSQNRVHFPFVHLDQNNCSADLQPGQRPILVGPQMINGCGVIFENSTFNEVCRYVSNG